MNEARWAVEKRNRKGEWWQRLTRCGTREEADRAARGMLKRNRRIYDAVRVLGRETAGYVEGAVPVDY